MICSALKTVLDRFERKFGTDMCTTSQKDDSTKKSIEAWFNNTIETYEELPQDERRISYDELRKSYKSQMREFTADSKAMFTNMRSQQASKAFAKLAGMLWEGNGEIDDAGKICLPVNTVRDGASTGKNGNTKRGLKGTKKSMTTVLTVGETQHILEAVQRCCPILVNRQMEQ